VIGGEVIELTPKLQMGATIRAVTPAPGNAPAAP
jgi:hypothetical protein